MWLGVGDEGGKEEEEKKKQSGEGENNLVHLKKMLSWYPGIRSHAFA